MQLGEETHHFPKPAQLLLSGAVFMVIETFEIVQWFLKQRVFLWLGELSFSIYILHELVMHVLGTSLIEPFGAANEFQAWCLIIAVSVVLVIVCEILNPVLLNQSVELGKYSCRVLMEGNCEFSLRGCLKSCLKTLKQPFIRLKCMVVFVKKYTIDLCGFLLPGNFCL